MDKYNNNALDRTFAALGDSTRRAILARLSRDGRQSVSALAEPFAMSLPALMKHLSVLERAGLIARVKRGRTVTCSLSPSPIEDAMAWLQRHEMFWTQNLDQLAAFVEETPCPKPPRSPSTGASTRRARKSTPRGPTRRN